MQDRDADIVNNQRRRRKRVGKIKSALITIIAGWILISMVLIIVLFVKLGIMEHKLKRLEAGDVQAVTQSMNTQTPEGTVAGTEIVSEATEQKFVSPVASGIEDEDNLAAEGDIHKVYLTFEDGPSENTSEILDVLAQYDVKATFFVVGKEDEESLALYKRIVEEGHTLGMHSYSNKYSVIYQSKEGFEEDLKRLQTLLKEATGVESIYYRFPGGSSNQISNVPMEDFIRYLNEEGLVYYDWNVSSGDASNAYSSDEIVANVTADVVKYKTSVVLLHDAAEKDTTVEALGTLIQELKEMGVQILPIEEDTSVIQYVKAESIE